ncbi:MAG: hypothetical protein AAF480_07595 [Actinomycetota bacterium]
MKLVVALTLCAAVAMAGCGSGPATVAESRTVASADEAVAPATAPSATATSAAPVASAAPVEVRTSTAGDGDVSFDPWPEGVPGERWPDDPAIALLPTPSFFGVDWWGTAQPVAAWEGSIYADVFEVCGIPVPPGMPGADASYRSPRLGAPPDINVFVRVGDRDAAQAYVDALTLVEGCDLSSYGDVEIVAADVLSTAADGHAAFEVTEVDGETSVVRFVAARYGENLVAVSWSELFHEEPTLVPPDATDIAAWADEWMARGG